jgi:hypothetical protein
MAGVFLDWDLDADTGAAGLCFLFGVTGGEASSLSDLGQSAGGEEWEAQAHQSRTLLSLSAAFAAAFSVGFRLPRC